MNRKKQILLVVVLAILVITVGIIGWMNRPAATVGAKTVTVEVIHGDGAKKVFTLHTDAETLRSACDEEKLIQGEDGWLLVSLRGAAGWIRLSRAEWDIYLEALNGGTVDEMVGADG